MNTSLFLDNPASLLWQHATRNIYAEAKQYLVRVGFTAVSKFSCSTLNSLASPPGQEKLLQRESSHVANMACHGAKASVESGKSSACQQLRHYFTLELLQPLHGMPFDASVTSMLHSHLPHAAPS